MQDSHTGKRVVVQDNGKRAPSRFKIRASQLDTVLKLLEGRDIEFWADDFRVSVDDDPPTVGVNISRNSDPKLVQTLLDTLP